jgi:hypothetical protein
MGRKFDNWLNSLWLNLHQTKGKSFYHKNPIFAPRNNDRSPGSYFAQRHQDTF